MFVFIPGYNPPVRLGPVGKDPPSDIVYLFKGQRLHFSKFFEKQKILQI